MATRTITSVLLGFALAAVLVISAFSAPAATPGLYIGILNGAPGSKVDVPVNFDSDGAFVSVALFRIQWDPDAMRINPTDANNDGIPDDILFNLPPGFEASIDLGQGDEAGALLVTIFDSFTPLPGLPDSKILTLSFTIPTDTPAQFVSVYFSEDPQPFFTNSAGKTIPGIFQNGGVSIGGVKPTPSNTPPPSPTTSRTPTQSPTPSITPTPSNTPTPSLTPTVTNTPSPTSTPLARFFFPALLYNLPPTATATATHTPTATASNTPIFTATPTATATRPPATATPKPPTATPGPFCANLLLNPGFEDNSGWLINLNAFPAGYVSGIAKAGQRSMRIGIVNWWDNRYSYSSVQQTITLPATAESATLRFWLFPTTTGTRAATIKPPAYVPTNEEDRASLANDVQMVLLFDQAGAQHVLLFQRQQFGGFAFYEMNLNAFIGQRVTMYFGVFNNGTGGITGMYLDEATLTYCD